MTKKKTIESHEKEYYHIPKIKITPLLIIAILTYFFILLFYNIGLLWDHHHDVNLCELGASSQPISSVSCFANDDFNKYNLGHDISCTCFGYIGLEYIKINFVVRP